jgi:hypothetical protein
MNAMRRGSLSYGGIQIPENAWILKSTRCPGVLGQLSIVCHNIHHLKEFYNKAKYADAFAKFGTGIAAIADRLVTPKPADDQYFASALGPIQMGVSSFNVANQLDKQLQRVGGNLAAMNKALRQIETTKPQLSAELSKAIGSFAEEEAKRADDASDSPKTMEVKLVAALSIVSKTLRLLESPPDSPKQSCSAIVSRAFAYNLKTMLAGIAFLLVSLGIVLDKVIDNLVPGDGKILEYALVAGFTLIGLLICFKTLRKASVRSFQQQGPAPFCLSKFENLDRVLVPRRSRSEVAVEVKSNGKGMSSPLLGDIGCV